jgi:hypothetical protein
MLELLLPAPQLRRSPTILTSNLYSQQLNPDSKADEKWQQLNDKERSFKL